MDAPKYRAFISYSHRDARWGTYQAQSVSVSGSENTNAVTTPGYYQATLNCPGTAPVVATFLVQ